MNYVDDIKLGMMNDYIYVDNVNFRESICKPCNELFDAGYIDVKSPALFGNLVGHLRFSNYLPEEEVEKHIMRLRQYYNVGFEETTYYVEDRIFYFNFLEDNSALKITINYFENLFDRLVKFIKNRIFGEEKEREDYMHFSKELYEYGIFSDKTIEDIRKDYIYSKEHDNNKEKMILK